MGCADSKEMPPPEKADPQPAAPAAAEPAEEGPAAHELTEFEWDDEGDDVVAELPEAKPPPNFNKLRKQRQSVSAEVFDASATYTKKKVDKSEEARNFIRQSLEKIVLFMGIDEEQTAEVIDACEPDTLAAGATPIVQGDKDADFFYILESGNAEASLKDVGVVKKYDKPGMYFGELALMYSAPRAATITCTSECKVWKLDRTTFKHIVIASTRLKREKYETFLKSVPLFEVLGISEIAALADVLEPSVVHDGEVIIKEGDSGDSFYIVEEGTVVATTSGGSSVTFERGSYFGEIALLTKEPRKATCVAKGKCKIVMIDVTAFSRLLGKAEELLKRNAEKYNIFLDKGAAAIFAKK